MTTMTMTMAVTMAVTRTTMAMTIAMTNLKAANINTTAWRRRR